MRANRAVFLGGIPVVLILAVMAFALTRFAAAERDEQGWVAHSYEVMASMRAILADALDAETGQRGYLLTRKPAYLKPFHEAEARLDRDLDRFQTLSRDNPDQQRRVQQLRALFKARFKVLNDGIVLSAAVPAPPLALLPSLDAGKAVMDTTRAVLAVGMAEEHRLLDFRIEARCAVERNEILAAILVAVLALLVFLIAAFLIVRNNVRLALSEALRARQARILQATVDNIRDGILVFDEEAKVAAFNEIFFRLMDFPTSLAAMGTALKAFNDVDEKLARETLASLPESALGAQEYARFQRNNRALDVYKADIPQEGFVVAAADVTERVRAEQVLRNAQKMESIGQLTGGMAHDFNNLLQIIGANLDLLVKSEGDASKRAARLQSAVAAVERGARLTGQLLAFARRQALDPRSTNLGRMVQEMTDLLRRTLGERIEVEAMVAGGLWNTLVDRSQVENAILNLAINSRDAMPEGGKLTIEVANAFLDDTYAAEHAEVAAGQYVMLAISDTGQGMPAGVIARAFDPFFTTKPEGQGTGLGLSQVFGFVKQSGGHVKIYSEIGEGTTIKIYLPRSRKPQDEQESPYEQPVIGGTETILVVEDDDGVRAAVTDLLSELGYTVLKASNAEEALTVLKAGADVDLLFTDVVMPGQIPTRELARRAKDSRPGLRVLFTSGYTQNAIVHNGKLDDDVSLLSKPYRKDDLARKLRSLLDAPAPNASPSPAEDAAAHEAPSAGNAEHRKLKVLIVEDVALIRMTTVDMVESLGHATLEAGDGPQALALVEANPDVDVMLTDLGLPGMSGIQLVKEVRALRPKLKIVIASGYSTESAGNAELPKDVSFMPKPYNDSQLKHVFEEG
ncbi:MAG: CHASE3 domain-containing protein [Proteobacteria bacterium]|nr:CHASE3 domain-containing protein [Pseudomonadota bacterium]